VIDFSDGSMIALKFGAVFTGQADQLVNALTRPGRVPRTVRAGFAVAVPACYWRSEMRRSAWVS
jgi:hypothetical protein